MYCENEPMNNQIQLPRARDEFPSVVLLVSKIKIVRTAFYYLEAQMQKKPRESNQSSAY